MLRSDTFQPVPIYRLLENYRLCLLWRLELWFGPGAEVQRVGSEPVLTVTRDQHSAIMEFHPELCRWTMTSGAVRSEGSFDRASKRLRQLFSGLP